MPKKKTAPSVGLRYPPAYIRSCMANRFKLETEEGFTVAHFGLVNRSGRLLDRFSCVFPEHTLTTQRENLVQYSDKIGIPKNAIPQWEPPDREAKGTLDLSVIDFVHVSHWMRLTPKSVSGISHRAILQTWSGQGAKTV